MCLSIVPHFAQFLSGLMGGPVLYDEENIKPAHYHMNITDYHFDAVSRYGDGFGRTPRTGS